MNYALTAAERARLEDYCHGCQGLTGMNYRPQSRRFGVGWSTGKGVVVRDKIEVHNIIRGVEKDIKVALARLSDALGCCDAAAVIIIHRMITDAVLERDRANRGEANEKGKS